MRLLIAALLILAPAPALAADWWEAETDHFIIKSEDDEEDVRAFAVQLERFDTALRTLQGLPVDEASESPANKPVVYRFGRVRDMARLAGASGSGIAGFFISRAGATVAFVPVRNDVNTSIKTRKRGPDLDPALILFHEYTHYFMMQHFPSAYPDWYVEGYAEMMSTTRLEEDGSFHVGDPPQARAFQVFQMSDFPLDEMLDAKHELSPEDQYQHYGTGWLLAHYLNFNPERIQQLRAFLADIANGADSLTAASERFGDLDELEREMRRYKRGPFPGFNVRPADNGQPEVAMRQLTEAERALIGDEMRSHRGVDEDEAESVLASVESKMDRFPDSAHAYLTLAEASLDAKDYAGAEAAAARAVEIDPSSAEGWLFRARTALETAEDDAAAVDTARRHLARAVEADPDDPRPLILYYETYYDAGEIPEHAIIALEQAFDHAGSDPEYRLLLGRQLLLESRFPEARTVLLPIAFRGHATGDDDEDEPSLEELAELLKAEDRDQAIAVTTELLDLYRGEDDEGEDA